MSAGIKINNKTTTTFKDQVGRTVVCIEDDSADYQSRQRFRFLDHDLSLTDLRATKDLLESVIQWAYERNKAGK